MRFSLFFSFPTKTKIEIHSLVESWELRLSWQKPRIHNWRQAMENEEEGPQNHHPKPAPQNPNHRSAAIGSAGKSCKGCLYFSSLQKSKSKAPTCIGFSRTLHQGPSCLGFLFFFFFCGYERKWGRTKGDKIVGLFLGNFFEKYGKNFDFACHWDVYFYIIFSYQYWLI